MKHRCPVCGFAMPFPPSDNNICSCCGTEFGYDDLRRSHTELRKNWRAHGMRWFSEHMPPPTDWDPTAQLNSIILTGAEAISSAPQYSIPLSSGALFVSLPTKEKTAPWCSACASAELSV